MLADEPTKGLDADRTGTIIDLLNARVASGAVLLVITHDVTVARRIGGRLLDTVAGLIPALSGKVHRSSTLGRTDIQKVYQDPLSAFPARITLRQSLNDTAKLHGVSWTVIDHWLERLGVASELLDRWPNGVSGGELQRIALTRALIVNPRVLLADEPTSRLDPVTQKETLDLLAEVCSENDIAVLLVTHDPHIARKWTRSTVRIEEQ